MSKDAQLKSFYRRHKKLVWLLLIVAVLAMPVKAIFFPTNSCFFDQETWKAAKPDKPYDEKSAVRMCMLVNLKNHHLKPGMTLEQVFALLGEPDEKSYKGTPDPNSKIKLTYGAGANFFGDSCGLVILLQSNKIEKVLYYCY